MSEGDQEVWRPGSFTKNFSWGENAVGLSELHKVIRLAFNDQLEDVPRALFRERIAPSGRPDFIPMNFFLFNRTENGSDVICADELVFQALSWEHSPSFDRIALFAFLISFAGKWKGSQGYQRRPSMWANSYVRERLARELNWNTSKVSANDIEIFVKGDPRYKADTTRKLATNLAHLFKSGGLKEFPKSGINRWWVDCLFLALDRIIEDMALDGKKPNEERLTALLDRHSFMDLTGGTTLEKKLAVKHLVHLYVACGGRERLSDEKTLQRTRRLNEEICLNLPNDTSPKGAVHFTNPRILKSIPAVCSELAQFAGFDVVSSANLDDFDINTFIHHKTSAAIVALQERGIKPELTEEELMKMTRDK